MRPVWPRDDVAAAQLQALAAFQHAQFSGGRSAVVAVGADAEGAAGGVVLDQREEAVAHGRLGERAEAGHRAAGGQAGDLGSVEMGGVDEAPVRPQSDIVEQPLHRARAQPCFDLRHLMSRFRDMDVKPGAGIDRLHARQRRPHLVGRDGAQRVQRHADIEIGMGGAARVQGLDQLQIGVDRMGEALLRRLQRLADAAMRIKHRQHGHAEAGLGRRRDQPVRHLRRIGMGAAAGKVVDIVEFADGRHAELEHLQIDQRPDRLVILRRQAIHHAVHLLAPGPQIVLRAGRRDELRAAGQRALKGVRMQVRQAWHAEPIQPLHRSFRRPGARYGNDDAILADLDIARRKPAVRLMQVFDLVDGGHGCSLPAARTPDQRARSRSSNTTCPAFITSRARPRPSR